MRIAYVSALLFVSVIGFGQAPQRFSFQAVVRHPDTSLVTFKQISVRISILKGDINGTVVYSETHSPRTNGLGLFTLEVGGGMVQSGDFSSIPWGNDSYFLKREIDPTGGTNYTISGTSQMLSVPYALHAESANRLSPDIYIGQDTFGGIVFHIERYPDKITGLVVSKSETTAVWSNTLDSVGANSFTDGQYNTNKMIDSPAKDYVTGLSEGGYTDWYIPAYKELEELYNNFLVVNSTLLQNNGTSISINDSNNILRYFSSTETKETSYINNGNVYTKGFITDNLGVEPKTNSNLLRAIRKFEIIL